MRVIGYFTDLLKSSIPLPRHTSLHPAYLAIYFITVHTSHVKIGEDGCCNH